MNVEDYQTIVSKNRPNLKANSARTYAVTLKSLAPTDAADISWTLDTKYVLKTIEKYKDTTRKNCLNAVIVVIDPESDEFMVYTKERDRYNQLYVDHNNAQRKTASQEKNWVEWPDYLALVKVLGAEVKELRGTLSKREKMRFQDYLIALLYSHYPLRNDFGDVKVVSASEFKKISEEGKRHQNYLVKRGTSYSLVLNEYKTSKKYGEKTIELNAEVNAALRRWFRYNDSGYLLVDPAHQEQALGSNGITKSFAKTGMRRLDKRLGSSLLRHSYLSHKYADVTAEKKKDADMMLHSVAMAEGYIKS